MADMHLTPTQFVPESHREEAVTPVSQNLESRRHQMFPVLSEAEM
jgi:thioredoxin reductase (NADPH)